MMIANRDRLRIPHIKRRTTLMRETESRIGVQVESYIADRLNGGLDDGVLIELADDLLISASTLRCWMLSMGIRLEFVALLPGERAYAIDRAGNERLVWEV